MLKKSRNQRCKERLLDSINFRINAQTRSYIEEIAESENVGLCEAARIVMQAGIEAQNKVKAGA
jgi:hypothetical protein